MKQIITTALRFIRYDKTKSIGIITGILISTFLIGQQLGIFTFLTGLMASLVSDSNAQIWVVDRKTKDINQLGRFDIRYLSELKSIPGVAVASPLVLAGAIATTSDGNTTNLQLVGTENPLFLIGPSPRKIIQGTPLDLLSEGSVSADVFDDKNFGRQMDIGSRLEINGKEAFVRVRTRNIRGFGYSLVFTTLDRARFFGNLSPYTINAVLINPTDAMLTDQLIDRININFPSLRAWKKKDLAKSSVREILGNSGIASSTGTLVVFALITGILIIGLTMYSSVLDRLRDYGTMRAIGAGFPYLVKLLLFQALFFALTGFLLAWILLEIFRVLVVYTGLLITYEWYEIVGLFCITTTISVGGMFFALRRLRGVEPASVFRN
ncbi:MAG: ABC transporter permease [Bacteroidales bacterium]